jgi:hypothetical protein
MSEMYVFHFPLCPVLLTGHRLKWLSQCFFSPCKPVSYILTTGVEPHRDLKIEHR